MVQIGFLILLLFTKHGSGQTRGEIIEVEGTLFSTETNQNVPFAQADTNLDSPKAKEHMTGVCQWIEGTLKKVQGLPENFVTACKFRSIKKLEQNTVVTADLSINTKGLKFDEKTCLAISNLKKIYEQLRDSTVSSTFKLNAFDLEYVPAKVPGNMNIVIRGKGYVGDKKHPYVSAFKQNDSKEFKEADTKLKEWVVKTAKSDLKFDKSHLIRIKDSGGFTDIVYQITTEGEPKPTGCGSYITQTSLVSKIGSDTTYKELRIKDPAIADSTSASYIVHCRFVYSLFAVWILSSAVRAWDIDY